MHNLRQEEREREKRKSLLNEAQIQQLSSEVSSSEEDEAAQCSNLRALALVENETKRYPHPALSLINTHTNTNIPFPRLEKENVKKRAKRYPSYGHDPE